MDVRRAGASWLGLPSVLETVGPAFVGRDAEMAWLRSTWLDAADGRGEFVSVIGPEGIGKTRLVAELAREVQRSGGVVLYARCDDNGTGVRDLLGQALDSASLSGAELDGVSLAELGATVVQVIAAQSSDRTTLLAFDDVHWADPDTIEVLADLAAWSNAGSLLVVATFRSEAGADVPGPPVPGGEVGAHLVLGGLDRDALRRVCEVYAVDGRLPDDLERLHELTGGVPLRVHELASEWARERAAREVGAAAQSSAAAQVRLAQLRGGDRAERREHPTRARTATGQRRATACPRGHRT